MSEKSNQSMFRSQGHRVTLRALPSILGLKAPSGRPARRGFAGVLPGAALLAVLTGGVVPAPARAQDAASASQPPSLLRLRAPAALQGQYVYWFTNADRDMSARLPLPASGADGALTLPIPLDFRQPGALVNVLDVRRGLIARLPATNAGTVETGGAAVPAVPVGPNLLQNGDFTQGAEGWNPELSAGKASGTFAVSPDAPPPGIAGKAARLSLDAIDKEAWHSQFVHYGLALTEGQPYTLTFWAKAGRDRPINVLAALDHGNYHTVGLSQRLALGPQWRKYVAAFTATDTQGGSRITFVLGDALGTVDLAGVTLQQGVYAHPLGDNILQNTALAAGLAHWATLNQTPPATGSLQSLPTSLPSGAEGNALRLQTLTVGAAREDLQFGQEGINLEPNALHTLSLWARADKSRIISVHTDKVTGEYYQTGLNAWLTLTPQWRRYDLAFTPSDTRGEGHRLVFMAGDAVGNVDIAGLTLRQGGNVPSAAPTALLLTSDAFTVAYKAVQGEAQAGEGRGGAQAHRSHPLVGTWQSFHKDVGLTGKEYQRYRFVFDASGKGSQQVTSLTENVDAPPKSQQTETFKWQLIEGGPHVSIGANVYTWTIEKDGDRQKLTLKNYEGKTYILFRQ